MLRLIDEQLGRVLLVLAVLVACAAAGMNQYRKLEYVPKNTRSVQVELDRGALTANANEVFFLADDGNQYTAGKRIFLPEKKVTIDRAVDLGLPPAGVMRPPQLLPEPGPALEGTAKLSRYGDEFPAVPNGDKPPGGQPDPPKGLPKAPGAGGAAPAPAKAPGAAADTKTPTKTKDF